MKVFLLLLLSLNCHAQKLFSKNNIASYGLCFIAGASDGMNDAIVAGHGFQGSQFWDGSISWENKDSRHWFGRNVTTFTSDGYHLTKFVTYTCFTAAIVIHVGEKKSWKQHVAEGLVSLACFKAGWFAVYKTR